jgi:Ca2+-binding RTX toxin-like protein
MTALKNGRAGIPMPILQTLPDFIVNSSTTDFQVEPAITTLADGRVVMTWRSFDNGDGLSTCIRARIFNANGTPTGADFIVNSTATAAQSNPAVAVLANGNIVFSWESDDTADTSLGCIRTRIFSDTGTAVGADFVSNTTTAGQQFAPTVTALTDGRFLLTWDHFGDEDGPGDEIHARLFNADGTPVAADFVANSTLTGIQSAASVSALSAGRFVMTWMSSDPADGSMGAIRARIFNANGTAAGADFIVNSTATSDQVNPAVTVLSDGRMIFTWQSYDSGDGDLSCIRARIYNAAGVASGADFIVNTTSLGAQSDAAITALADGRFVVAWASTDTGDGADGCIRARLFNLDGTPAGDDFIINTTGADYQFTPVLTALPNGTFQVAWMSLDTGDGSQSTIRSTIFNPNVFNGTPLDDTWVGGNLSDTIYGNDGNDLLYGKDGADIIDGGNGNDHLWGGNGADQLIGGAGLDYARYNDANYGDLTIRLDNSALNVGAAAVGDTYSGIEGLVGGVGNDTIIGNASNNYLSGLAGNDIIDGGAGNDVMTGGDGNDTYFVDTVSDTVNETNAVLATGGDDLVNFSGASGTYTLGANVERLTLQGSAAINGTGNDLDNTITGNSAANIIDGGAGADIMNGGDRSDTYYVDSFSDAVFETNAVLATGGDDLVNFSGTSGTFTLGTNIERLTLLGSSAINGTGNALNNTITGNSAANIIDGAAGVDTMIGGDGDDTYYADTLSDIITETNAVLATGGDDLVNFTGTTGTYVLGTNIERLTLLGTSAINGTGNALDNTIIGNSAANTLNGQAGSDTLDGGVGTDTMIGGDGNDIYFADTLSDIITETNAVMATGGDDLVNFTGTTGTYVLGANVERLTLLGSSAINGTGNALNNTITGNSAANTLDGGTGADTMIGGDGSDTYSADAATDVITETNTVLATGGDDLVNFSGASGTFTLGANIERLALLGSAAINGTGNALNNTITGNAAANIIDGGAGADIMNGGDGSDTYYVDSFSDLVSETNAVLATGGNDLVNFSGTSGTFTLGSNIERLTLLGTSAINGTGNALNNTITGNAAANIIDGGTGNDTMNGGDGDDTYYVDSFSDVVSETNAVLATGGNDLVYFTGTTGTLTIGNNIERLTLLGTSAINGTGNALNNTLTGNSVANTLSGLAGNDVIDGGLGIDTMLGGDGNDIYYADVTTDVITETNAVLATGGDDLVYFTGTTGTFTIGSNIERLTLTGSGATSGIGNTLNNTIVGNSGANQLYGGDGNDVIDGGDGNDQLYGGNGADQYIGGNGTDYARYDDANYGNLVINLANSSLNSGTSAVGDTYFSIEGVIGGAGYDIIYGNSGDNYLNGGAFYNDLFGGDGNDTLIGGERDDWFYGGNGADTMDGGLDLLVDYARYDDANYGNLTIRLDNSALNTGSAAGDIYINIEGLIGGEGNDSIFGNSLANYIHGQGGNDIIDGLGGNDVLFGRAGNDRFQFATALNATNNVDQIRDFTHGADDIGLAQSIFASIGTTLDATELRLGTVAADANDFIIYNAATGQLFYDANGNGAGGQTLFATVTAGTVLDINDFVVV